MLWLSLVTVVVSGCGGSGMQTVAPAHWQTVPAAERAVIDKARADDLAHAQAQEKIAAAQVAVARKSTPSVRRAEATPPADLDASALAAWRKDQRARTEALAAVDTQRAAWQRANVAWHEQRVVSASAHVGVVKCQIELARAAAVDEHAPASDVYDTSAYRGQLGRAQEAWYRAEEQLAAARHALDAAVASLADAKETYAALVRGGAPVASREPQRPTRVIAAW